MFVWTRNAEQGPDIFLNSIASVACFGMHQGPSTVTTPQAIRLRVIEDPVEANVYTLITIPSR